MAVAGSLATSVVLPRQGVLGRRMSFRTLESDQVCTIDHRGTVKATFHLEVLKSTDKVTHIFHT